MADVTLTYSQVLITSLASGALGGFIGAGSSYVVARVTGKQQRQAAMDEREAAAADRKEERRVTDLRMFQEAVDTWSKAWSARLVDWAGHTPQNPPPAESFLELMSAGAALRTAAARVGDRALIGELDRVTELTSRVAALDAAENPRLGGQAGEVAADLVYGAAEMISKHCAWQDAKKVIYGIQ
jgi:hypothetical protein